MDTPTRTLLDEIASAHDQNAGFTPRLIQCRARVLNELIAPGVVLDLGCADGLLTQALARHHKRVVAVDASTTRCQRARSATQGLNVEVVESYFETFVPSNREEFDAIILSCILEHLDDPVALLRRGAGLLAPGGVVAAIVPHRGSVHRRVGVHMGLLKSLETLGPADDALDHKRVYTQATLAADMEAASLKVTAQGGILFKPLPNAQMTGLAPSLVDAFEALGRELPELAAEIYAIGRLCARS